MLNTINYNQQTQNTLYAHQSYSLAASPMTGGAGGENEEALYDTVSIQGESESALTYSSGMTLSGDESARYSMLQSLVANLLQEQGIDTKIAVGDTTIDIASLTPEDARELVAEDGYFGVEQTSERIFQFAIGIAGGDRGRIEAIKQGVDQGFQEAVDAFGGWLPDISYDTYDAVMAKLDNWAVEAQA